MSTPSRLTPKAQAELLLSEVLKGKKVHEYFTEQMKDQILISGHPISYWEEKFRIKVPLDLTPATARHLNLRLIDLNQEATFLLNLSMVRSQLIKHGNASIFMGIFNSLVAEFKTNGKKLPAQGTLENLAKFENIEIESALAISEIEIKYWRNIIDHLSSCASNVKNASLMISTEMKHTSIEKNLDSIENRLHKSNNTMEDFEGEDYESSSGSF